MKVFIVLLLCLWITGCAHQTAMSDPKLSKLWAGYPVSDELITEAKTKWPNEKTLLDMQQGLDLLRRGDLTPEETKRAQTYLESAFNTFEDLKDPENFSKAFTSDNQTPFRGKPYERMMTAILLGLMDVSQGRCDRALPAFKSAEFLDARWQAFMFGSDAPMIYALTLRCQLETKAALSDVERSRDGLDKALRLQILLEPLLAELAWYAGQAPKEPGVQIALSLLEVGLPSALLVAPAGASLESIFSTASAESMRFLSRALKDKEEPYYSAISPKLKKLKDQTTSVELALQDIEKAIVGHANLGSMLKQSTEIVKQVETALKNPVAAIYFDGIGPSIVQEGDYNEIAKFVPGRPSYAIPGVPSREISAKAPCGISNPEGNLIFTMCRNPVAGSVLDGEYIGLKLWSSSFQATTTAGRRFDKILKGRAQFRMGTEIAALVGAYTAMALLSSRDSNVQIAGAVIGAVALGAFLAGRATNPEADTRQVKKNLESGYLLLLKQNSYAR
ncbi:MAG: hypothetical protein WCK49_06180 [Myxococcaceae bacterium]